MVLAKKDQKLVEYRLENRGYFSEYWLAIVGIRPGTVEDGGFVRLLERDYATDYDRVFLIIGDGHRMATEGRDVTPDESSR
jgi:hypothetical protein